MKKWMQATAILFCLPIVLSAQPIGDDQNVAAFVETVIEQVGALHNGMPRSSLDDLFILDGGAQFFGETRYLYRRCRSIKIRVKFRTANGSPGIDREDDVIVGVSKPFLELPFYD